MRPLSLPTPTLGPLRSLLILAALLGARTAFAQDVYTLAVVPQFPRLVLIEDWQPLLDTLSERIGVRFELRLQDDIPAFERAFLAGEPDLLFMNPYHAVMAWRAHGYLPLVSDGSRQLEGILVVRSDSAVRTVADLEGEVVAFPAPNAFGASLYMRALLAVEGVTFTATYVETHSNVYRHVLLGEAAAGGGVRNTLAKESQALRDGLRIVYATPGVRPHPLGVHPRVPAEVRAAVVEELLALYASDEGRALLRAVQLTEPIRVSYPDDYATLERLELDRFVARDGF